MYFATRSVRQGAPVLICPAFTATARSAIKVSSVSPDRWEMMVLYPLRLARSMACRVSVKVPIWLGLMRMAFPAPWSMPCCKRSKLVTNKSSPTS